MDKIEKMVEKMVGRIDEIDARIKEISAELEALQNERYVLKQIITTAQKAKQEVESTK